MSTPPSHKFRLLQQVRDTRESSCWSYRLKAFRKEENMQKQQLTWKRTFTCLNINLFLGQKKITVLVDTMSPGW